MNEIISNVKAFFATTRMRSDNKRLRAVLQEIIECETDGANATVRRMARIAKAALR